LKGIGGITPAEAQRVLDVGILSNWWLRVGQLPAVEIPARLKEDTLRWHQNRYADPDPDPRFKGHAFGAHTPFISVTAGTVERDAARLRNIINPAWQVALEFATDGWQRDGYVFSCYVFVLGRKAVPHQPFAEELRELNVYASFSLFQPEGEITAKISIPPAQIARVDFFAIADVQNAFAKGRLPTPTTTTPNPLFQSPADISNVRGYLI
jgi:hypothetical protein